MQVSCNCAGLDGVLSNPTIPLGQGWGLVLSMMVELLVVLHVVAWQQCQWQPAAAVVSWCLHSCCWFEA